MESKEHSTNLKPMTKALQGISVFIVILLAGCSTPKPEEKITSGKTYEELVTFFKDWRDFASAGMVDGVPDYSVEAMSKQQAELALWQKRLKAFDTTGWPIKHQIDWYLIWAEMNGLDFDHRVRQPWTRDPAFYVWFYAHPTDVPAREGPVIHGAIELSKYAQPISEADASELADRLRKAPAVYQQARANLTGNAKDLWILGTRSIREQAEELESFETKVSETFPDLAAAARVARKASAEFASWLDSQAGTKTGLSGVGKENYSWNLKKVHLIPYTWADEKTLVERELTRAHSSLRLVEHKNRNLPKLEKVNTPEKFDKMMNEEVTEFIKFLKDQEIMTMKDYMEPALRARIGKFKSSDGLRSFFAEIDYRSPLPMRCHQFHWIELARMREEPNESPIRQIPSLFNIFDSRSEGIATAMEELMMNAGLSKNDPRIDELVYVLLAQRAARALSGLYQHGLEMDFDAATKYASKWVPWGLLPADGGTIQHEAHFYLQQPAYGTSYVIGKIEIDKLIAEYARQRDGKFVMKEFMDEFSRVGEIPISLVYWQMTGDKSMLNAAIAD